MINKNSIQCKKDLIKQFKLTFTQKQFYGNEYFEGDVDEMIEIISNYIITDNKECKREDETKGSDVKEEKQNDVKKVSS